jgi:putative FmdB family regulatory protein
MPIYGYECSECEHIFDALQKMSDPRLVDCPQCGESSLRKQLSAPKFRLKGKGWYETDFKTGDKRNLAGDADKKSAANSKDADKPAKKTETKKTETKKSTDSKAKTA